MWKIETSIAGSKRGNQPKQINAPRGDWPGEAFWRTTMGTTGTKIPHDDPMSLRAACQMLIDMTIELSRTRAELAGYRTFANRSAAFMRAEALKIDRLRSERDRLRDEIRAFRSTQRRAA